MAYVYQRGSKWWVRVKDGARWVSHKTSFLTTNPEDKRKAQRFADRMQHNINVRRASDQPEPVDTVRAYITKWLDERRVSGHDWMSDRGKLNKHVLPVLGATKLAELRAVHIAELVRKLRFQSNPKLAPRTVRNIYTIHRGVLSGRYDRRPHRNEPVHPDLGPARARRRQGSRVARRCSVHARRS